MNMTMSLSQLADKIGADLKGDPEIQVSGCAPIDQAQANHITFVANAKYQKFLSTTQAGAVIIDSKIDCPDNVPQLVSDDPYFAFRNAVVALSGYRKHPIPTDVDESGISAQANVHPTATVGKGTIIHPFVVIDQGASIGSGCVLYPGSYVGCETTLGDDCVLFPNVSIYERCTIGNRVSIHSNTSIGQDGFGYATHGGEHHKIPQVGVLIIEDDVEIGSNCAIERATIGETRIGSGTKFGDLIAIGHGTTIGSHCLLVSLVGIAGSVEIGNYVVLAGQVGVSGHIKIGDGVQAAGKTAIVRDVEPGKKIGGGVPAVDFNQAKRNALAGMDLYGWVQKVRKLEKQLEQLKKQIEAEPPKHAHD